VIAAATTIPAMTAKTPITIEAMGSLGLLSRSGSSATGGAGTRGGAGATGSGLGLGAGAV